MKFSKRLFCVFSCFVLLFAVFSLPVSAEELDTSGSKTHVLIQAVDAGEVFGQTNVNEGETGIVTGNVYHDLNGNVRLHQQLTVANIDGSIVLKAGSNYSFYFENITFKAGFKDDNGYSITYNLSPVTGGIVSYRFVYADGTYSGDYTVVLSSDNFIYNSTKQVHNYKLDISPDKDIIRIIFNEYMNLQDFASFNTPYGYVNQTGGFEYPMKLTIDKQDETVGLLDGILGWIKEIVKKIGDTFDVISSGFANIGTWFSELPGKIWSVMENGIKGLFVPDAAYMESYSDKWDLLLSDRLGAVYQVGNIVIDSWDDIMSADETDSIEIPKVTIPLPQNTSFSFGGYSVKIVPDGFGELVSALKLIVGIVCTYLFVNGLLKRYEEVMGVEK